MAGRSLRSASSALSAAALVASMMAAAAACQGRGCGKGEDEEEAKEAPAKTKPKKAAVVADCERYAQTFCELYERCDRRNYEWTYDDPKKCRAATTAYCAYELRAPGSGDTPKAINDCAEAFTKTSCDDWGTRNTPATCHPPGTRKIGEACEISAQCESYWCKLDAPSETCGKCQKLPEEGDPCPNYLCQVGTLCISGRCQKPKKDGDKCTTDTECVATSICFKEKRWAYEGVCKKPLKTGDACRDPSRAWDDELDEEDLDELGGGLGSLGGTIGVLDAGKADAKTDASDADVGTDADAKPGKPTSDCDHRAGATCIGGTCAAEKRLAIGDKCTAGAVCKGGYCELGTCEARRKTGQKCDRSQGINPCIFPAKCVDGQCRVLDGFECDAPPKSAASSLLPFR